MSVCVYDYSCSVSTGVVVSMSVANLTVMEDAQHARIQLVVDGEADYVITGTIKPQAVPSLHGMYSV